MNGAKNSAHAIGAVGSLFDAQEMVVDRRDVFSTLGKKEFFVLARVHDSVPNSAEHALDRLKHATRLERLDDKILCTGLDGLDHQGLLTHGTAHKDSRLRVQSTDLSDGIDSSHVGHYDVHGHEVRPKLSVLLDRLDPRFGLADDLEPGLGEDVGNHRAHKDRVVAYQDRLTHELLLGEQNLLNEHIQIEHENICPASPADPSNHTALNRHTRDRILVDRADINNRVDRNSQNSILDPN